MKQIALTAIFTLMSATALAQDPDPTPTALPQSKLPVYSKQCVCTCEGNNSSADVVLKGVTAASCSGVAGEACKISERSEGKLKNCSMKWAETSLELKDLLDDLVLTFSMGRNQP